MKADRCDIYTDVDGVYTTDPRIVPRARKLDLVTYEEMLELASVGAKVLQTRSVGLAMRYNMPLQVLSSFEDRPGTLIVGDDAIEDKEMERNVITGIAHDKNEAMVTLTGLPDTPGTVAAIFAPLADAERQCRHDRAERARAAASRACSPSPCPPPRSPMPSPCSKRRKAKIGFDEILTDTDVVKVSASASACAPMPASPRRCSQTLAERGINILAITTSEIKVSVLIPEEYTELAVRVLHTAYGLDAEDAE